ncbi:sporulation protein [Brevibacillus choshinensis]|uniref:Sporulation protein n=1 Tax=Brevibacillus choshinensis TaxID=54911 RepID=A0ABR5NCN0_BRECH|nr:sporulation protein YpjB [Brevibacillus choshinensis]KQL49320.1 sporulation protein [Brevibacillus choshinensis]
MKKNIRYLLFFLGVGLFLSWPIHNLYSKLDQPIEEKQLAALDQVAHELLTNVKKGDIENAQKRIVQLAEQFPNQHLPIPIRIESLNAVTQSILAAKQSFASTNVSEQQLLWHATQVRVAIDALTHVHQPMWRSYYPSIATQVQNLQQSAVERNFTQFREQFDENYRLYLAIKPAMSIQLPEGQMSSISASYNVISKEMRNSQMDWQLVREALRDLNGSMQAAFVGEEKSTFALLMMRPDSPMVMIVSVGIALLIALSYVAWKKYDGQIRSA